MEMFVAELNCDGRGVWPSIIRVIPDLRGQQDEGVGRSIRRKNWFYRLACWSIAKGRRETTVVRWDLT